MLYFIQRMRDEAHRFAIGTHRAKRAKAVGATPLDEVPGVGAARKRALLAHFGSAKAVGRANLADLKAVAGVSEHWRKGSMTIFRARIDAGPFGTSPTDTGGYTINAMIWNIPNILTLMRLLAAPMVADHVLVSSRPYADWFALSCSWPRP